MAIKRLSKDEIGPIVLVIMRVALGWFFLWAFLDKTFGLGCKTPAGQGWIDGGSPTMAVKFMTSGVFADLYNSIAGNALVDALFMIGILILGITLILGFASKLTTIFTVVFMILMYCMALPPANNPIIDEHIMYLLVILVIYYFGGFEHYSLEKRWKEFSLVKRFSILE